MADAIEIRMEPAAWAKFKAAIEKMGSIPPIDLMWGLARWAERHIQQTFRADGAISGFPAWEKLAYSTTNTPVGTRKLRYGSWKVPKNTREGLAAWKKQLMKAGRWTWGQSGFLPGYESQVRYLGGGQDRPMQASGAFKRSFKVLAVSPNSAHVGSMYLGRGGVTAEEIAGKRSILRFNSDDWAQVRRLMIGWALGAKA